MAARVVRRLVLGPDIHSADGFVYSVHQRGVHGDGGFRLDTFAELVVVFHAQDYGGNAANG